MKKMYVILTVIAFVGISALSLNLTGKDKAGTDGKKTECVTATASSCGSAVSAAFTSAASAKADCSSKAAKTADGSCGSAVNAVLTSASSAKADCSSKAAKTADGSCGSAVNASMTVEKASDCSTPANATLVVNADEKPACSATNNAAGIAENN